MEHSDLLESGSFVSIPFKREGLSELILKDSERGFRGFVSIPFKREGLSEHNKPQQKKWKHGSRFNSLQTGRTFRTRCGSIDGRADCVSIPFKREGLSERGFKLLRISTLHPMLMKFQFPSNGKDFPNRTPSKPSHSAVKNARFQTRRISTNFQLPKIRQIASEPP